MRIVLSGVLLASLAFVTMSASAEPAKMSPRAASSQSLIVQAKASCTERCQNNCSGKHAKCFGNCMQKCK